MIDKVSMGKIIKSLRMSKKMTQEELSEKIDISKNYLSKIERGLSILNAEAFLKMAEALNFTLADFGVNTTDKIDSKKERLVQKILSLSQSEIEAYTELFDTTQKIIKILK